MRSTEITVIANRIAVGFTFRGSPEFYDAIWKDGSNEGAQDFEHLRWNRTVIHITYKRYEVGV